MADYKFGDGIKTFFLAGVGAVALTAEKSQEIIADLVKKGELTVEQGKDLNKDLQRSFKESMDKKGVNIDELSQKLSKMSADELAKIKEQIAAAEKIVSERLKKAEEKAAEAAEDVKEAAEEIKDAAAGVAEDVKEAAVEAAEDVKEAVAEEAPEEEAPAEDEEKPAE
jgi:polyhydroxyalkanoate synthesis regulator phasin